MIVVKSEVTSIGDDYGCHNSVKDENNSFVKVEVPQFGPVKEEVCGDSYQSTLNIDESTVVSMSSDKYTFEIENNDQVIKIEKEELDGYVFESEIVIEKNGLFQTFNGVNSNTFNNSELVCSSKSYCITEIDQNKKKQEKNIYICALCHQKCNSKKILILHIKNHSQDLKKSSSDVVSNHVFPKCTNNYIKVLPKKTCPGTKIKFMCTYCLKSFSDQSNCHRHTKYNCPILKSLKSDMNNFIKRFKCLICKVTFNRKHNLQIHQQIHTGETPFKCDVCQLAFHRKDYLETHKKIHNNNPEKHFCKICQKKLSTKRGLLRHEKSHVICYSCDYCGQSFPRKDSLVYHLRSKHTDERPYKCNICQKSFFNNSCLIHHKNSKIHKLNVKEKKFKKHVK